MRLAIVAGALLGALAGECAAQTTTLVSRNSAGAIGDGAGLPTTGLPALSADGGFVAFVSFVPDFVSGDTNGVPDVFLRNRHTSTTIRVSVGAGGAQGNDISGVDPEEFDGTMGVSSTGRFVVFPSAATNLVGGDTNGATDIFVRDTLLETTERVSVSSAGVQANGKSVHCGVSASADGRFVVFDSDATNLAAGDTNGKRDIFLRDRVANTTERVSVSSAGVQADQHCMNPFVSSDGRYVVFTSEATNLAAGGNAGRSIFLRDRVLGQTFRIALTFDAAQPGDGSPEHGAVSDDGRFVAFASNDPALLAVNEHGRQTFVRDRVMGTTERISRSTGGALANQDCDHRATITPDGRYVGFTSQASNLVPQTAGCVRWQAYMRDRQLGTTTLVSVSGGGTPADGGAGAECLVAADGSVAVFATDASNLDATDTNGRGDVYVRAFAGSSTSRVSVSSSGFQGTAYTGPASAVTAMTPDARYVVLLSTSGNMAPCFSTDGGQVYVRDLVSGVTELISLELWGGADAETGPGVISDNGRYVAFTSDSSSMTPLDSNGARDIFRRDRATQTTTLVSVTTGGVQHNGTGATEAPSITGDGRYVVFHSDADNLAGVPDNNGWEDVFVRDMQLGVTTLLSRTPGGAPGNGPSTKGIVAANGAYASFASDASTLVPGDTNLHTDIFRIALGAGNAVRVSVSSAGVQGNGDSFDSAISGDGRYVAFVSAATNLVPGDTNGVTDVFWRDIQLATTVRVSIDSSGAQGNGAAIGPPAISRDGRFVAFASLASNLVSGDTNGVADVFVHDTQTQRTVRVSVGAAGEQGDRESGSYVPSLAISGTGRSVAFTSLAGNLVAGDTNNATDAFLRDTQPSCPADFNGDGQSNSNDVSEFLNQWFADQAEGTLLADYNGDGETNSNDVSLFLNQWFVDVGGGVCGG